MNPASSWATSRKGGARLFFLIHTFSLNRDAIGLEGLLFDFSVYQADGKMMCIIHVLHRRFLDGVVITTV